MKYTFKNVINENNNKNINKIFTTEIKEIYSILSLLYEENNNCNDALLNIGILDTTINISKLESFFEKNFHFSLDELKKLSNNLECNNKYCSSCPINKYCNTYRNNLSNQYEMNNYPTIIDLFCRCRRPFIRI